MTRNKENDDDNRVGLIFKNKIKGSLSWLEFKLTWKKKKILENFKQKIQLKFRTL